MILKQFSFTEVGGDANPWILNEVDLGQLNLIVGMNATGKSRLLMLLNNFGLYLSNKLVGFLSSEWNFIFDDDGTELKYSLGFSPDSRISKEVLIKSGQVLIDRSDEVAMILAYGKDDTSELKEIAPPPDKPILTVRRDAKEYPEFEKIVTWAENTIRIDFDSLASEQVMAKAINPMGSVEPDLDLSKLGIAPYAYEKLEESEKTKVLKDIRKVGFEIKTISSESGNQPMPFPGSILMFHNTENGLDVPIPQIQLSTGLLRALSLIVVVNYLLSVESGKNFTLLIDDFAEGMDYERANNLSSLIFDKLKGSNVQLIAASNSRAMMNGVSIKHWNILQRNGHKVRAVNYSNSKELFDKFSMTGLNNFDLFSSDYLTKKK